MENKSNYKSKGKFKKKKSYPKNKDKASGSTSSVEITESKEKPNDPSWYIVNGQLAKDVASFSFNTALGAPVMLDSNSGLQSTYYRVPGIMPIYTVPSCGYSIDATSPVNMASKNIYTFVRHMNSGSKNYDSPDLMMYLLAMDSAYSWYSCLTRLYGTLRLYSQTNRYFGDALINAQGFHGNIKGHMADLRYYINQFAIKLASFVTPTTMGLYRRHAWMYGNYFKDAPTVKSQMYMYVPAILFKYNELNGPGRLEPLETLCYLEAGTGLRPKASLEWQDIINITENIMAPIVASEDMNIISGDILKAYGQGNVWSFDMINEDYVVAPIYSEEILSQIHNSNFAGNKPISGTGSNTELSLNSLGIYQDSSIQNGGRIYCTPRFATNGLLSYEKMLDMYMDEPTPEDVLVASRNMLYATYANNDAAPEGLKGQVELTAFASDICLFFALMQITETGTNSLTVYPDPNAAVSPSTMAYNLSKFNQVPIIPVVNQNTQIPVNYIGDLNNFTVLDFQDVYDLHSSAVMSMLALPLMGMTSK